MFIYLYINKADIYSIYIFMSNGGNVTNMNWYRIGHQIELV